jgi:class 3 adenylate cyclase
VKSKEDLEADLSSIFQGVWTTTEKTVIPVATDLGLGNDAGHFGEMTVLYADLNGSTSMVDNEIWQFSAEVYKAYLHCAAHIIRNEGGTITAYDGDRIMAVFTGNSKNTSAVRCAMKLNYAVIFIINPELKKVYSTKNFMVLHTVGIDTSEIHVARIGVKNDNDLVWVGRAANYAAKLSALSNEGFQTWISAAVFESIHESVKTAHDGRPMWVERSWTSMRSVPIYGSLFHWSF